MVNSTTTEKQKKKSYEGNRTTLLQAHTVKVGQERSLVFLCGGGSFRVGPVCRLFRVLLLSVLILRGGGWFHRAFGSS